MYYGLTESNTSVMIIVKDSLFLNPVYNGTETCFDDLKKSSKKT